MPSFDILYDKVKNIAVGLVQCNDNLIAMSSADNDNDLLSQSKAYIENRAKIEALLMTIGLSYNQVAPCLAVGDSDHTALNIVSLHMSTIRYNLKEETFNDCTGNH